MTAPVNLRFRVLPSSSLQGSFRTPGDKSISHRSIMLGALAEGVTEICGFLEGEDSLATLKAFQLMGVTIEGPEQGKVRVHGVGLRGLKAPQQDLYLGNSGTSMRLLCGLLAAQSFPSVLSGDESLSSRPMCRVTDPLALMGACIESSEDGTAPLRITPVARLQPVHYDMPMASAQVKSCLLLAGLYAQGETCVSEPGVTRDHTERMLQGMGYAVHSANGSICLKGGGLLQACPIDIPADISSATFFMVGASIAAQADILLQHVGINTTRDGVI
ncbi:MAG: 3-phosphoshikimate 1-carboxyvinyltransferase, partial [gamma proteobacterium symbiont of Bathyaustriella thionipta]|nr:3-phosphoshikimate 1-carboxyvinyltransferase [gamma proteobacterium symbiont of Bathyaustriella thionipta]